MYDYVPLDLWMSADRSQSAEQTAQRDPLDRTWQQTAAARMLD